MAKVCVFIADGFEEVEGLTVVDLLRRAEAEVMMVSLSDSLSVTGSHGIEIKTDVFFDDVDYGTVDMLVLPGGMPGTVNLGKHQSLCRLLKDFNSQGKKVAAICAAPTVLALLGILDQREAVCYPGFEGKLKQAGAKVLEEAVVRDGNITTSRGVGTAVDFALELISQLEGDVKSHQIKKSIVS